MTGEIKQDILQENKLEVKRKKLTLKINKSEATNDNSQEVKIEEKLNFKEENRRKTEKIKIDEQIGEEFPEIPMDVQHKAKNEDLEKNKTKTEEVLTQNSNNNQVNQTLNSPFKNNFRHSSHQNPNNKNYQKANENTQNNNYNEDFIVNTEKVLNVKELINSSFSQLSEIAKKYEIQSLNRMLKSDIVFNIMKKAAEIGEGVFIEGYLEIVNQNFGVIKYKEYNYASSACDIYISIKEIAKNGLRMGDKITCYARDPKKGEKFFALARIETINNKKLNEITDKINFENLTPLFPQEKFKFDFSERGEIAPRVIDLICPLGKGQRALIVAPPRTGKTVLMKSIAHAINDNHPEVELIVLLVDERPEEVTEMSRSVKGEVVSSTFDEPAHRHVELAEIVIEKAKRLVEDGKDVVILMDSITRLARAYNATAPSSGKVLTGGVDSNALQKPKRFFGAARNIEFGGSLTIIATALVDTGSKMDEVIFEEFKGTGNSEIVLDRKLSERGVFPSIDIFKSGTRKEEEMLTSERLQKQWILKRFLHQKIGDSQNITTNQTKDAVEFFIDRLKKSENNEEFFVNMNK